MNGGGWHIAAAVVLACSAIGECDHRHEIEPVQPPFRIGAG